MDVGLDKSNYSYILIPDKKGYRFEIEIESDFIDFARSKAVNETLIQDRILNFMKSNRFDESLISFAEEGDTYSCNGGLIERISLSPEMNFALKEYDSGRYKYSSDSILSPSESSVILSLMAISFEFLETKCRECVEGLPREPNYIIRYSPRFGVLGHHTQIFLKREFLDYSANVPVDEERYVHFFRDAMKSSGYDFSVDAIEKDGSFSWNEGILQSLTMFSSSALAFDKGMIYGNENYEDKYITHNADFASNLFPLLAVLFERFKEVEDSIMNLNYSSV